MAEPDPRTSLTGEELVQIQTNARIHLTFSLTLACPLRCAHCIVEAGPDKGYTTMPLEVAELYSAQMEDLFQYGIRMASFTGGEPLLARKQLAVLSSSANHAGIVCGVVTAAHWADSEERARKVVADLPGIHTWDISIDAYHKEFLPFERVRIAYDTCKNAGKRAVLRFAYNDPMTAEDREVFEFLGTFASEQDICSQRIHAVGRARYFQIGAPGSYNTLAKPCVTKGLVIRYDGSMAPCCINLVEERRHPFQLGDARARPLRKIHEEYMTHPLLQMLRVVGFGETLRWLKEARLDGCVPSTLPEDVCDLCPQLVTRPDIADYLAGRAAHPGNRLRTGVLASRMLNEHQMLHRAVEDLKSEAQDIDGFEFAAKLAAETQPL